MSRVYVVDLIQISVSRVFRISKLTKIRFDILEITTSTVPVETYLLLAVATTTTVIFSTNVARIDYPRTWI